MNIVHGALFFFSERGYGKPFVNCLLAAVCMVLRWMGYDLPSDYSKTMRTATGIPVVDPKTKAPLGLNFRNARQALRRLLPKAVLTFGTLDDTALLRMLPRPGHRNRHSAVVAVLVDCQKLPRHYRRLVGVDFVGLHGVALGAVYYTNEFGSLLVSPDVLLLDPMGRPAHGYRGERIGWDALSPALIRNRKTRQIRAIYGRRNTAVV